jgi:hypothetical protein
MRLCFPSLLLSSNDKSTHHCCNTSKKMEKSWSSSIRNYSSWRFLRSTVPVECRVAIERVRFSLM